MLEGKKLILFSQNVIHSPGFTMVVQCIETILHWSHTLPAGITVAVEATVAKEQPQDTTLSRVPRRLTALLSREGSPEEIKEEEFIHYCREDPQSLYRFPIT